MQAILENFQQSILLFIKFIRHYANLIKKKDCVCGVRGVYFCKSHQVALYRKHRALHEEQTYREHIYEKLGQKLTAQRFAKIVVIISSKIKITDQCAEQILEEYKRIGKIITDSYMRALVVVKQKQRYYVDVLRVFQKRIF